MIAGLYILVALWIYPVIGLYFLSFTKKRLSLRTKVFKTIAAITGLAVFGLVTNISTTNSDIDWLIVTIPFLMVSLIFWWTQYQKNRTAKNIGLITMIIVFGFSYFISTIGILGVGFVVAEFETDREERFENGLIYKELSIGNAISDYRGKRIEITKTFEWFPLVEWHVQKRKYLNLIVYGQPLNVNYNAMYNEFYLKAETQWNDSTLYWSDTIRLDD